MDEIIEGESVEVVLMHLSKAFVDGIVYLNTGLGSLDIRQVNEPEDIDE